MTFNTIYRSTLLAPGLLAIAAAIGSFLADKYLAFPVGSAGSDALFNLGMFSLLLFLGPMLLAGLPYILFILIMLFISAGKPEPWLKRTYAALPILFLPFIVGFCLLIDTEAVGMIAALTLVYGYCYIAVGALFWLFRTKRFGNARNAT